MTQPLALIGDPLVNYGETIKTNRGTSGTLWADYQCLLIGSCFVSTPVEFRERLAGRLWQRSERSRLPARHHCY